jgi:hypothetical protein
MKKEVIFGLFGLIGLTSVALSSVTKKKDAENIGDYLGMGMQGISYDLPNGKVLKIIDLKTTRNKNLARFMNYYAVNTANGELKPHKHLPTIDFFQVGYANRQLEEEILEEMPKNSWRDNIIEYNTPVAMWVIDKYGEQNKPMVSIKEARNNLMNWFEENNLGKIDDLHEENYGINELGDIVFFDFDVEPTKKVIAGKEIM